MAPLAIKISHNCMFCWEHYLDWDQKRWAEGEAAWTGGRLYYSRGLRPPHLPFQVHPRCFGKIDLHSHNRRKREYFLDNEYVTFAPSKNPGQQFWQIILRLLSQYAWTHLKFLSRIWRLWDCVSNLRPILNNYIIMDFVLFLPIRPFHIQALNLFFSHWQLLN